MGELNKADQINRHWYPPIETCVENRPSDVKLMLTWKGLIRSNHEINFNMWPPPTEDI